MTMPYTAWMKARKQQTFWLTEDEAEQFAEACKKQGITKSQALRDTVLAMLSTLDGSDGNS